MSNLKPIWDPDQGIGYTTGVFFVRLLSLCLVALVYGNLLICVWLSNLNEFSVRTGIAFALMAAQLAFAWEVWGVTRGIRHLGIVGRIKLALTKLGYSDYITIALCASSILVGISINSPFGIALGMGIASTAGLVQASRNDENSFVNVVLNKLKSGHRYTRAIACVHGNLSAAEQAFLYHALRAGIRSYVLNKDEELNHLLAEYVLVQLPVEGHYGIPRDVWNYLNGRRGEFLEKWKPHEDASVPPRFT